MLHDETRRRDVGLVAVLLEEHPLQYLGARDFVSGQERRALGEVPKDGVRLRQIRAIVELERRDSAVRVALQEFRRARFAGVEIDFSPIVALTELREQQTNFIAVTGIEVIE